jgi:uncharacterized membrane protein YoaK (UPF0700 family)
MFASSAMRALHAPDAVFSARHLPSWLILAFSAGAVNVVAFLACSRFVSHISGTVSSIGMNASIFALALDSAVVLGCFVVGAMTAAALLEGRDYHKKAPLFAVPLLLVSAILAGVGALGALGAFGVFGSLGGSVEGPRDFVFLAFLSTLSFAMGLQNAAVATSTGLLVRTTHMTGPATDLGTHLTAALYTHGDARRGAFRHAGLRAGKIAAFACGGATGAALASAHGYAAFFVPSAIVLLATALSFSQEAVRSRSPALP